MALAFNDNRRPLGDRKVSTSLIDVWYTLWLRDRPLNPKILGLPLLGDMLNVNQV